MNAASSTAAPPLVRAPLPSLHDAELEEALRRSIDGKTKPVGSLGRLEALACRIGRILGEREPSLREPQLLVCAGDHGLAARGISAYPSDVTWQMVMNFLAGGAAVSVLARQHGLRLTVVDCGVRHDFAPAAGLLLRKVASGTADAALGPAMTRPQCLTAIENGRELVRSLPGNAVLLGEMGIGNTSSAALLLCRLAGLPLDDCIGPGTGLDADGLARKRAVLAQVAARHAEATDALDVLGAFGGFEIATLAGVAIEAAAQRRVVVVDGFITAAAVLVAESLRPGVAERCVAAHVSAEPGHALLLRHLGLDPLLELGMRLGEGSGAALAWPLLPSACAVLREMASFESAGVSQREPG